MIPWCVSDEAVQEQTGYVPMGPGPGLQDDEFDSTLIVKTGERGEGWDQIAGRSQVPPTE